MVAWVSVRKHNPAANIRDAPVFFLVFADFENRSIKVGIDCVINKLNSSFPVNPG